MSALVFIARTPLFCARCGSAAWTEVLNIEQRTVECLNKACTAYQRKAVLNDPRIVLLERPSDLMPEQQFISDTLPHIGH